MAMFAGRIGAGYAAYNNGGAAVKGLAASGVVKNGNKGVLVSLDISNLDAAVAWVQVFDAADNTAVTLGTTVPNLSFRVPASGEKDLFDLNYGFNNGLVIACTTTANGLTSPSTGVNVNITYA